MLEYCVFVQLIASKIACNIASAFACILGNAMAAPSLKLVNMRTAQTTLSALVRDAQTGPVCLTRYGRPLAIVVGVEGRDLAEVFREWDPGAQPASGRRARKKG